MGCFVQCFSGYIAANIGAFSLETLSIVPCSLAHKPATYQCYAAQSTLLSDVAPSETPSQWVASLPPGCARDSGPACRSPGCARDSGLVYRRAAWSRLPRAARQEARFSRAALFDRKKFTSTDNGICLSFRKAQQDHRILRQEERIYVAGG